MSISSELVGLVWGGEVEGGRVEVGSSYMGRSR